MSYFWCFSLGHCGPNNNLSQIRCGPMAGHCEPLL